MASASTATKKKLIGKQQPGAIKRPYLRQADRRQMLLDAAAQIVESQGWSALSMMSLAQHAQITRQLVYQHFDGLEALLSKTAWHIFQSTNADTRASIASVPNDLRQALRLAVAITLDLPEGRAQALWELIAGSAGAGPEMQQVRLGIRKLIENIWLQPLRMATGFEPDQAKATVWMLVMAFWGMRQRLVDGDMTREQGVAWFEQLVARQF